jgi:hypothetical protein
MAMRPTRRHDHGVSERGFADEVDLDRLFGFHVLEAVQGNGPNVLFLRSTRSGVRKKRHDIRFTRRKVVQKSFLLTSATWCAVRLR